MSASSSAGNASFVNKLKGEGGARCKQWGMGEMVLMRHEDLELAHDLGQGGGAVVLPVLDGFDVVDVDDEVFVLALVVHFGKVGVSAGHCAG